jgi:hypothetical protein
MNIRRTACSVPMLLAITFGAYGCSSAGASQADVPQEVSARVEQTDESQPAKIMISERASQRLGIRTTPVRSVKGALIIPYSAVVYDADGDAWAFSEPQPLTFIRVPIKISSIKGDSVRLGKGPPPGTLVVIVGAPELVGAEAGISSEE